MNAPTLSEEERNQIEDDTEMVIGKPAFDAIEDALNAKWVGMLSEQKPICNLWIDPITLNYEVDHCDRPSADLTPVYKHPSPDHTALLNKAYLAGFSASGEGYNGEFPFGDRKIDPESDPAWTSLRDEAIKELL